MMRRALVFRHYDGEDLSTFAPILSACGYSYRYINTPTEALDAQEIMKADLLVIMGGPMGVYETEAHPYLLEEIKIARRRVDASKPTLGVCLGSQILAAALGADVYKGPNGKEIGWRPLRLTEEGKTSALRHLAAEKTNMFHWHGDTFDLPKGVSLLASSDLYRNQAFSLGSNVLAVQFHAEISKNQLCGCFEDFAEDLKPFGNVEAKLEELRRDTEAHSATLEMQNAFFLREWLEGLSHA
ncbi:MAG: glutamine amidotransferase [Alphaproteobacteria bacterium]|nr:glutamine amidotransferase [Alphaproteobacteria bacterium]MBP7758730.1 glutamine amidotransferase [Alphaproteobacteria bacterium]MBP7761758.1 glutamine amidotransferase [Alphaproteobacteria bacterium]MBP7903701.1 glutamine amidotransferase [Alphaproteobacteria bacterium]